MAGITEAKKQEKRNAQQIVLAKIRRNVAEGWQVTETVTADPRLAFGTPDGGRLVSLSITFAAPLNRAQLDALDGVNKAERNAAAAQVICELFNERAIEPADLLGAAVSLAPLMGAYGDCTRNDTLTAATSDPFNLGTNFAAAALAAAKLTQEGALWKAYLKTDRTMGAYIDYRRACKKEGIESRSDIEKGNTPDTMREYLADLL